MGGRNTTAAVNAELAKQVTKGGHFLYIGLASGALRWCDYDTLDYDSFSWGKVDFTVRGISFDADRPMTESATLTVQNLDGAIGALLQVERLADVPVIVWKFEAGALAAGDAIHMAEFAIDSADIDIIAAVIKLRPISSRYATAPWLRVEAANGLAWATPAGTIVQWGNQTFEVSNG